MSSDGFGRQLAAVLSGRWQIPVALAAIAVAGTTVYRLIPRPEALLTPALMCEIAALEERGETADAADALANVLDMQPNMPPPEQAEIHDRLAELIYRRELARPAPNLENVRTLLVHHDAAERLARLAPDPGRTLRAAQAADWLGNPARAVPAYRAVLAEDPTPEQWRRAAQGLVRLLDQTPGADHERHRLLESLLSDEGVSAGYLWWALQEALQEALDQNDTVAAEQLLEEYGARLKTSDLKGYGEYLWAWVKLCEGRPEEAAPLVAWVDEWLGTQRLADRGLSEFGHLPAMNRWLLGQIHLAEQHPEEAEQAFREAIAFQPFGELQVAATAGRAAALIASGDHVAGKRVLLDAVEKLETLPASLGRRAQRLQRNLFDLYARMLEARRYPAEADSVIRLPAELTRQRLSLLAQLEDALRGAQDEVGSTDARRAAHGAAARCLEQAAGWTAEDEPRCAALLWAALEEYDQAGQAGEVRRVARDFVGRFRADPRVARAKLLVGQSLQATGEFDQALQAYRELSTEFPTLEEGYRARRLSAACARALGRAGDAESSLCGLLADDAITPQAGVFRDALLDLCELLFEQGRYGEAIGRLEDFGALFPEDAAMRRVRFLVADAYRRSAEALRDEPPADVEPERVRATSQERFRQAAALFAAWLDASEAGTADEGGADLYERVALFNRADCLQALGEPEALREALEEYQRAAARYPREPAALTAYVQMANVYVLQGEWNEAARAVERARRLLPSIPDGAFAASGGAAERARWERYLSAISASDAFEGLVAGRP